MSTSTLAAGGTLDFSDTRSIPMTRLVGIELRKLAGKWLLIGIAAITLTMITIFFLTAAESDRTFLNFVGHHRHAARLPAAGARRTPGHEREDPAHGARDVLPRAATGPGARRQGGPSLIAGAAITLALLFATAATAIGGSPEAWTGSGTDDFGKFGLLQAMGLLHGLALGLLFLNTAAAIVTYFVLPTAVSIVAALWTALSSVWPWVDPSTAQQPLFSGVDMTGAQWS